MVYLKVYFSNIRVSTTGGEYLKLLLEYYIISIISVQFFKYYYCWTANIDNKLLVAKFIGLIIVSILISIFVLIFARILSIFF